MRRNSAEALDKLNWRPDTMQNRILYLIAKKKWDVLIQIAEPAVEPLIDAMNDEDPDVRRNASEALGEIGDSRAVEPLISALGDKSSRVQRSAAEALDNPNWKFQGQQDRIMYLMATGKWDDLVQIAEPAVEPLIDAMNDDDFHIRCNAAEALGEIGDSRAVEPLIVALKDEDSVVSGKAAEALDKLNWQPQTQQHRVLYLIAKKKWDVLIQIAEPAVEPLIVALKHEDYDVRENAGNTLIQIGEPAFEALVFALQNEDSFVRWKAASILGEMGDSRAVEPLIMALKDEEARVRWYAAEALGEIGDSQAVEPLIDAMNDEDSEVRGNVANALGEIGDSRAVGPLIIALKDEYSMEQSFLLSALRKITGQNFKKDKSKWRNWWDENK